MKLNIGCGTNTKEGFVNIDVRTLPNVDIIHDLNKPLPIEEGSVDHILAWDVLEHFSWRSTDEIFGNWIKVLKKGGIIKICVPNIEVHFKYLKEGRLDPKKRSDTPWGFFVLNIFGSQDYPENSHYTTFCPKTVEDLFERHNLQMISMELEDRAIIAIGEKM